MQRLWPLQNRHFCSKIKIPKKHAKIHVTSNLELLCAKKTRLKKNTILKIAIHACKGYSLSKIVTLGQKLIFQKTCQNRFNTFLRVGCKKKQLKKHEILYIEMRQF